MSGDFVDSNVLVYFVDQASPEKRTIARSLIGDLLERGDAHISFQVVQETLNVITRKFQTTVLPDDARQFLQDVLVPLWTVMPTHSLYERALMIHGRYGYSFYDALIVAAALAAGCTRLHSENLQHGQRIEGLAIQNPFA